MFPFRRPLPFAVAVCGFLALACAPQKDSPPPSPPLPAAVPKPVTAKPAYCPPPATPSPSWAENPRIEGRLAASASSTDVSQQKAREKAALSAKAELAKSISSTVSSRSITQREKDALGEVSERFSETSEATTRLEKFGGYAIEYAVDGNCQVWALVSLEKPVAEGLLNLEYAEEFVGKAEDVASKPKSRILYAEAALRRIDSVSPAHRDRFPAYDALQRRTRTLLDSLKRNLSPMMVAFIPDEDWNVPREEIHGVFHRSLPAAWRRLEDPCPTPEDCSRVSRAYGAEHLLVLQIAGYSQSSSMLFKGSFMIVNSRYFDHGTKSRHFEDEFRVRHGGVSRVDWPATARKAVKGEDWKNLLRRLPQP